MKYPQLAKDCIEPGHLLLLFEEVLITT